MHASGQHTLSAFDPGFYTEHDLAGLAFKAIEKNVRVGGWCRITGAVNIELGDKVRIYPFCSLVAPRGGRGHIRIGSYVHIAAYCSLMGVARIVLGDFSGLSDGARIYSRSDDFSGDTMTNPTVPSRFTGSTRAKCVSGGMSSSDRER